MPDGRHKTGGLRRRLSTSAVALVTGKLIFAAVIATGCRPSDSHGAEREEPERVDLEARAVGHAPAPVRAGELQRLDPVFEAPPEANPANAARRRDAAFRERSWRSGHRDQDGIEAIHLLESSAGAGPVHDCGAGLRAALIHAEMYDAPEQAVGRIGAVLQELDEVSPAATGVDACARRAQRAIRMLGAYAPADTPVASVVVSPTQTDEDPAEILKLESYASLGSARIVIHLDRPATFELTELPPRNNAEPWHLVVDVAASHFAGSATHLLGGIVEHVQLARHPAGVRLTFGLAGPPLHRAFYLPEPFRLVVDVSDARWARSVTPAGIRRVVLDPGHGGGDPGAIGPMGLNEKDVALDIAHQAAPIIASELGLSTLLTRDTDAYVPLDERVARANAFGADLFVSIHCNASESHRQRGAMTFVFDASRDDMAARVAARENFTTLAQPAEWGFAMSRVLDPENARRSVRFAQLLQRSVLSSLTVEYPGVDDGGVRRAGFYVLAGAQMPAVLFEASFISNPTEEFRLRQDRYRERIADALVNAIRAYRDGY